MKHPGYTPLLTPKSKFSKGNKHKRGDDLLKLEASVIKKLKHFKK